MKRAFLWLLILGITTAQPHLAFGQTETINGISLTLEGCKKSGSNNVSCEFTASADQARKATFKLVAFDTLNTPYHPNFIRLADHTETGDTVGLYSVLLRFLDAVISRYASCIGVS